MLCVFPEWQESEESEVPISVIRFDVPKFRKLTHRDYLGTLMSLGIDRSKTGDILTDDEGAYVFVMSDIAEYVARNVNKIANAGVNTKIVDMAWTLYRLNRKRPKKCAYVRHCVLTR